MSMNARFRYPNPESRRETQRGVVLVIALVFLVMITMLALTVMRGNITEEKIAGNSRDWNQAFQAAEAALRDGEKDIWMGTRIVGATGFSTDCNDGLCLPQTDGSPIWMDMESSGDSGWMKGEDSSTSVAYGAYTTPSPGQIDRVSKQPRYFIEAVGKAGDSLKQKNGYNDPGNQYAYRVTARGFGVSADASGAPIARAALQTMYTP